MYRWRVVRSLARKVRAFQHEREFKKIIGAILAAERHR